MQEQPYLTHHGIKGQKWGIRRFQNSDGSLTTEGKKRYTDKQYKRDTSVYGRSGARRIRKNVEKRGESVSGARSKEAQRINAARRRAMVGGQIGSGLGTIAGAAFGVVGSKYASNALSRYGGKTFDDPMVQATVMATSAATASSVGKTLGRDGGRAVGMLVSGYSPKLYHSDEEYSGGIQNGQ